MLYNNSVYGELKNTGEAYRSLGGANTTAGSERMLEIGEKLTAVRKAKGLTQVQAAAQVGCTQSYLSAVENGKKAFSISFVLDLIRLYGVSYETIFGENHADTWVFETPEIESSVTGALGLLEQLVENAGSAVLEKGIDEYLKLCIYSIFKQLYESNPHNTGKMFASDSSSTAEAVRKLTENMPQLLQSLIQSCHISTERFELPVERGHELRSFIKECEELLGTE